MGYYPAGLGRRTTLFSGAAKAHATCSASLDGPEGVERETARALLAERARRKEKKMATKMEEGAAIGVMDRLFLALEEGKKGVPRRPTSIEALEGSPTWGSQLREAREAFRRKLNLLAEIELKGLRSRSWREVCFPLQWPKATGDKNPPRGREIIGASLNALIGLAEALGLDRLELKYSVDQAASLYKDSFRLATRRPDPATLRGLSGAQLLAALEDPVERHRRTLRPWIRGRFGEDWLAGVEGKAAAGKAAAGKAGGQTTDTGGKVTPGRKGIQPPAKKAPPADDFEIGGEEPAAALGEEEDEFDILPPEEEAATPPAPAQPSTRPAAGGDLGDEILDALAARPDLSVVLQTLLSRVQKGTMDLATARKRLTEILAIPRE